MLQLRLFGTGQASISDRPLEGFPNQQPFIVLCYLLLNRRRAHHRERLAALFWGDQSQEKARSCLNTALWRLRHVLEPEGVARGTYLLTTSSGEIGFNFESDYWLDVAAFEEPSRQILARPAPTLGAAEAQTLEMALKLYTSDLLEGVYDDWALRERERLRGHYLNCLAHLMDYYKHHARLEEGLACGQLILELDPLREEIQRELMHLYLANGQRALAVRQYRLCCEILDAELGIPPMEETQALYAQITGAAGPGPIQATHAGQPVDQRQALQQLRLAILRFDEARKELKHATQLIEKLLDY